MYIKYLFVYVITKMPKLKPCNKGCGAQIYLSDESGRWLPYNQGGTPHRCNGPGTGKETSTTYQPQGYVQTNPHSVQQIPTPQLPPPEPLVKLEDVMTALNAIQLLITDIKENQEALWERVDFIYQAEREAEKESGLRQA
jgi:hypothetical protein